MLLKHPLFFSSALCLLLGLLCGLILPAPWDNNPPEKPPSSYNNKSTGLPSVTAEDSSKSTTENPEIHEFDPADNFVLVDTAQHAVLSLKTHDYVALAALADDTKGIRFTPYSTVDPETDVTLTPDQIKGLENDESVYTWGIVDGRGSLIEMTIPQYFEQYVFNVDYTQAPQIGIDKMIISGNALENIPDAYPGCRFVDFCFPTLDPYNQGLDWCSLKLVFRPDETQWKLVGIVHSQWTV